MSRRRWTSAAVVVVMLLLAPPARAHDFGPSQVLVASGGMEAARGATMGDVPHVVGEAPVTLLHPSVLDAEPWS